MTLLVLVTIDSIVLRVHSGVIFKYDLSKYHSVEVLSSAHDSLKVNSTIGPLKYIVIISTHINGEHTQITTIQVSSLDMS